ncbi:MAG: TIGR01777 family oxidoreductase [Chloroflexota bacterium]
MNILIAGGSGFLGTALIQHLTKHQHQVFILTRQSPRQPNQIQWDARTTDGWAHRLNEMDAVIQNTGYGLEHWPWTQRQKQRFIDSRVIPGLALAAAFEKATRRPGIFIQASGINRYGLRGDGIADESSLAADDFLAQLTVQWEDATKSIELLGVRRIITRNAVILAKRGGLFPLMTLAVRLFFGGRFGDGRQSMPWLHIEDYVSAIRFLLENENARGVYNLIAPQPTSSAEFMRGIANTLHRPFWFHIPKALLQIPLGEMNVLLTEGRYSEPRHLLEQGFQFQFGQLDKALKDLLT